MTVSLAPGAVSFIVPRCQYMGASLTSNSLEAVRSMASHPEVFLLVPTGDKFALQTSNGKYVKAQDGGGSKLVADSSSIAGAETFEILPQSGDRIALRVHNGLHVCAWDGGGRELVADRTTVNTTSESWECFCLVRWVSLQAANGKRLQFDESGQGRVLANGDALTPASVFQLIYLDGGKVAFRTINGKFLWADYGGNRLVVNRDKIGDWEGFVPINSQRQGEIGRIAFRASNGSFLNVKDGEVTAGYDPTGGMDPFNAVMVGKEVWPSSISAPTAAIPTFNVVMLGKEVWPLLPEPLSVKNLYGLDDAEVKKDAVSVFQTQLKSSPSVNKLFFASQDLPLLKWPYYDFTDNVACALAGAAISRSAHYGFNTTVDQKKADASWATQLASADAVKASQFLYESAFPDKCRDSQHTFRHYMNDNAASWAAELAAHLTSSTYLNVEMLKLIAGKPNWLERLNLLLYKLHRLDNTPNKLAVSSVVSAWKEAFPDKGIVENWQTYNYFPVVHFQGDQFVAEVNQAIMVRITESDEWIPGPSGNPVPRHSVTYSYGRAVENFLKGKLSQLGITTGQRPNNREHHYS